jgi:lysophospholipase L1-like esterase
VRVLSALGATLLVFVALLALLDAAVVAWFPRFERVTDNFSAAYLAREIGKMAREPGTVAFVGDSVLWGYKLPAADAAPSLLRRAGIPARNLAFEGGSPANTYALLRVMLAAGVRPGAVAFNVNQKEFSPADSAYRTLHPSLEVLADPLLSPADRALLSAPAAPKRAFEARLDGWVGSVWHLYALRSDLREALFGDVDAAHALDDLVQRASGAEARAAAAHRPTPDRFEGTYDLSPLDGKNVAVHFLRETVALLAAERIPAVAILTPTNHSLLHEYIDAPEYRKNLAYVRGLLAAGGVRVLDLDARFPAAEFIDNDHLTARGNRRLAAAIEPLLPR